MENEYVIPTNFTDAGKLFGMFEIRNVIEALILCIPITLLCLALSPFGLTGTIILVMIPVVVAGGFAIVGIQDYSLFTFIRIVRTFKKNKRILSYRGNKWEK